MRLYHTSHDACNIPRATRLQVLFIISQMCAFVCVYVYIRGCSFMQAVASALMWIVFRRLEICYATKHDRNAYALLLFQLFAFVAHSMHAAILEVRMCVCAFVAFHVPAVFTVCRLPLFFALLFLPNLNFSPLPNQHIAACHMPYAACRMCACLASECFCMLARHCLCVGASHHFVYSHTSTVSACCPRFWLWLLLCSF